MRRRRILTCIICTLLLFALLPFSGWYQAANDIVNAETAADAKIGSNTGTGSSEAESVSEDAPYTPGSGYLQYLSDYSTSEMVQCTVGWGTYTRDKNLDGKKIKLQVNGSDQEFDKGVTAHASATLIYDLGEDHGNFDYFQAWIGIDAYRENNGNVKFQFFVSNDKTSWTELTAADNLNEGKEFRNAFAGGNTNAIQVKFDEVKTNRYLKVYIDKNGADTADHATLADAKLASNEEYKAPVVDFLKDASYYSAKLAGKSYAEIMADKNLEMALLQYRFMTLYGKDNLQSFLTSSMNYVKRINAFWWLFNDYEALKEFLNGGEPIGDNYLGALDVLADLYAEYAKDLKDNELLRKPDSQHSGETRSDLYRRMMLSMSLCCANGWNAWLARAGTCNPVNRYAYFKANYTEWKMRDEIFENLGVDELRWVVGNNISDAEIIWLNDYARSHATRGSSYPIIYSPHHHISYRWYNYDKDQYYAEENRETYTTKYDLEGYEQYGLTYGYNADGSKTAQRLWMVFADGAVCGNISRTGANLAACFGVAACEVGQPGHAAFCIMNRKSTTDERMVWGIDNNISGWAQSSNSRRMPCDWGDDTQSWATGWKAQYCIIAQAALNDPENYAKAEEIMMVADLATTTAEKEACYRAALSYMPYHLDAWVALINLYNDTNSGKTAQDIVELADQLCSKESQLCYYPKAMQDLKNLLVTGLNTRLNAATDEKTKLDIQEKISYVNNIAFQTGLQTALKATDQDCAQPDYAISTAKTMLNTADYTLATFSFDGDNANQLVFNSSFTSVRYRYSLDGGANWTKSNTEYKGEGETNVKIALTDEEIESITADNDIYIWLDGWAGDPNTEKAFKIDISAGQDVSGVEFNDKENRFIGTVTSMEYNLDNEKEEGSEKLKWRTLTNEVITELTDTDNHTITVHKKASGTTLQGNDKTYTATNNDLPARTYIPISQITLAGYSSEQTNKGDYAKYAIDGLASTRWHTSWYTADNQKYIILKTSTPKYFSGIDYLPPPASKGQNGVIYAGNVYVSMDGQNWMLAGSFKWNDDFSEKHLTFSQSVYGQYVKLVATGCHGGFAGGSKIELFEDTTLANKTVLGVSLLTLPTKQEYVQGESLDLSGATAKLVFADNTYSLLPVEMLTADKTVFTEAGTQLVTLSYGQYAVSFHVTVKAREGFIPTGITIAKQPDKLTYYAGDSIDTTGMEVTATDGSKTVYLNADEYEIEGDLSAENTACPVTVKLKSNPDIQQQFTVTVKKAIRSIAVTKVPDKTAYELGDTLDTTGLEVTAYYDDKTDLPDDQRDCVVLKDSEYHITNVDTFSEEDGDVEIEIQLTDKASIQTDYKVTVYGYFTKDGVYYAVNKADHTCTVMEIRPENQESFISIPESIQVGTKVYTVTSIGTKVMGSADSVTALSLPGSITNIDTEAFQQSGNLKQIFFTAHTSFDGLTVGSNAFNPDVEIVFYAANKTLEDNLKKQEFAENLNVSNVSALITGIQVTPPTTTTVAFGQKPDYTGLKVQAVLTVPEGEATVEKIVPVDLSTCTVSPAAEDVKVDEAGEKTVTVTLNDTTFEGTFKIKVEASKLHITENPKNAVYVSLTETVEPLSVKAESDADTDVLTYQWYRSESGTLNYTNDQIEGATEQTYTPSKYGFYYCQVKKSGTEISVYSLPAEVSIGDYVAIVGTPSGYELNNTKGYDSLAEAINDAAAGSTITLLKDVDLTAGITINKNLTINGNNHTIKRAQGYTGTMFEVTGGALNITELTMDGGVDWYYNSATGYGYSSDLERGWIVNGIKAQGPIIRATGSSVVSLNSSTLQNNYNAASTTGMTGGAVNAQNSAKINLTDTDVLNNYSEVFGSAVYQRDTTSLEINGDSMIHGNSGGTKYNTSVICVDNTSACTINGGTFCHNAGKEKGGIFWVSNGSLTLNGGTFEKNLTTNSKDAAITQGKLLYLNGSAAVTINAIDKIDKDEEIYLASGKTIKINGDLSNIDALVVKTTNSSGVAAELGSSADPANVQSILTINDKKATLNAEGKVIASACTTHKESSDTKVLKAATCTEKGIEYTYCTVCGAIITQKETACTAHTEVAVEAKTATCHEEGHTAGTQCSVCGQVLSGVETTAKLEHDYTITCTKEAKCEEAGEIQYTCKHCGDTYTEPVNQLGHDMYISATTKATTGSTGAEIHSCSRCDWQYTVELPKLISKQLQINNPQTEFVVTQNFSVGSGTVAVIGEDSKAYDEVSLSDASVTVTAPSDWSVGTKQVTVQYKGLTATYDIHIAAKAVSSVESFTVPTNLTYVAGKSTALDLRGGQWIGSYNDGSTWESSLSLSQISGTYDLNKAGNYELTATYTEGNVKKTEKFTIQVLAPEVTAITLKGTDGVQKDYAADTGRIHTLNVSGLTLDIELNGGLVNETITDLTAANFSGFKDNPTDFVQNADGTIPAITQTIQLTSIPGYDRIASAVTMPSYEISWTVASTTKLEINGLAPASVVITKTFKPTGGTVGVVYANGQVFDTTDIVGQDGELVSGVAISINTNVDLGSAFSKSVTGTLTYKGGSGRFNIVVIAKTITSAAFVAPTADSELNYIQHQTTAFSSASGHWNVTYNDESTGKVGLKAELPLSLQGDRSFAVVGDYTITVPSPMAGDPNATYTIHVATKQLQTMTWVTQPSTETYVRGKDTTLNVADKKILVTFNNGETAFEAALDASWCTGFNADSSVGTKTITVDKYGDYTFVSGAEKPTWDITFVQKVQSVAVTTPPTKTTYFEGDKLNLSGGKVTVTYYDGTTKELALSSAALTLSPAKDAALTTNDTAVSVTYKDTDGTELTASQAIAVRKKEIATAELIAPTKKSYVQDSSEALDLTGGYWKVTYNNGEVESSTTKYPLTDPIISGFDLSSAAAVQQVTLSQTLKLDSQNYAAADTFNIQVVDRNIKTVNSFTAPSNSTVYIAGKSQTLDLTGGKWNVTYNNGKTEDIALAEADLSYSTDGGTTYSKKLDFTKAGTIKVKAVLKGSDDASATEGIFDIVVNEPVITAVTLKDTGTRQKSYVSETGKVHTLDVTGLSLDVTYNGALTEENVTGLTADNFEGFVDNPTDFTSAADQTKTITLKSVPDGTTIKEGITMPAFNITWQITATNDLKIEGLQPANVVVKNNFVPTAGTVGRIYSNGQVFDIVNIKDNANVTTQVETSTVGGGIEGTLSYKLSETETLTGQFKINVIAKEIKEAVFTPPTQKEYIQGQTLDLTGGKWQVTYNDDSKEDLDLVNPSGYDSNQTGTQTITFASPKNGETGTYDITVAAKQVQSMEWAKDSDGKELKPTVTEYVRGRDTVLNVTGGKVKITFNNGEEAFEEALDASWCTGFNKDTSAGSLNTIKVDKFGAYTFVSEDAKPTWNIKFVRKVQSIAVTTAPTKTAYIEGEIFDPTGGKVTVYYYDDPTEEIVLTSNKLALRPDTATELETSDTVVAVQYKDADGAEYAATQAITVCSKKIVSAVLSAPTKTKYYQDSEEQLDLSGGYWKVTYDNGKTEEVPLDGAATSGFNLSQVTTNLPITVRQTLEDGYVASGSYPVTVVQKKVTKMGWVSKPEKTEYIRGTDTALDVTGGRIKVTYNSGEVFETDLNAAWCSGFDPDADIGSQTIRIDQYRYLFDTGVTVLTFDINVQLGVQDEHVRLGGVQIAADTEETFKNQTKSRFAEGQGSAELKGIVKKSLSLEKVSQSTLNTAMNQLGVSKLSDCKTFIDLVFHISANSAKTRKNADNRITAFTVDITPKAVLKLFKKDETQAVEVKTVELHDELKGQKISMSVALPDTFAVATDNIAYIEHRVDGHYHESVGTITKIDGTNMVNFDNSEGFSEFTVYAESHATAVIGDNRYPNAQDAIDELQDGETLELLQDVTVDLSSKPIGFKFTLKPNGHTLNYTVASDCELSVVEGADGTLTLTIVAKGTNPNGTADTNGISPNTGLETGGNLAVIIGVAALALVILIVWILWRKNHKTK